MFLELSRTLWSQPVVGVEHVSGSIPISPIFHFHQAESGNEPSHKCCNLTHRVVDSYCGCILLNQIFEVCPHSSTCMVVLLLYYLTGMDVCPTDNMTGSQKVITWILKLKILSLLWKWQISNSFKEFGCGYWETIFFVSSVNIFSRQSMRWQKKMCYKPILLLEYH